MRPLRVILCALALAATAILATAPTASAVDTRWYKFTWCDVRNAQQYDIHICSYIETRRQNDGQGLLVRRISHYLDITRSLGVGDPDDCAPGIVEQDPAVKNNYSWLDAENAGGAFVATKWDASAPAGNLTGGNNCWTAWNFDNTPVGTQRLESGYNYWLRINGLPDVTDENTIDVFVADDGTLHALCYVNDRCGRIIL
jgi:hypothetical protein